MKKCIFVTLLLLSWLPAAAWSQSHGVTPPRFDPSQPIHLQADRLEVDNTSQVVRFEGHVVATQEDSVLKCDILLIHYQAPPKSEVTKAKDENEPLGGLPEIGGQVRRLIALGRVQLTQKDRRAACERAEFDSEKQTLALVGNPLVSQGANSLRGSTIVIHVPNQQIEILGGQTGRVAVTINPGDAKKLQNKEKGSD